MRKSLPINEFNKLLNKAKRHTMRGANSQVLDESDSNKRCRFMYFSASTFNRECPVESPINRTDFVWEVAQPR